MFEVAFGIILVPFILWAACMLFVWAFSLLGLAMMFIPTFAVAFIMIANDLPATNYTLFTSILIITIAINGLCVLWGLAETPRSPE
jgi:hypothetical protein